MLLANADTLKAQAVSGPPAIFYVQINDDDLDFTPDAPMFSPQHYGQVIMSVVGVAIWLAVIATSIYFKGFTTVWKVYLVPYLWLVPISLPEYELELI